MSIETTQDKHRREKFAEKSSAPSRTSSSFCAERFTDKRIASPGQLNSLVTSRRVRHTFEDQNNFADFAP